MKNIPKKIYLQIGGSDATIDKSTTDWNDLFHGAITWADHRIYDNDIEFILSAVAGQSEQLVCDCAPDPTCRVKNGRVLCNGCNRERK